VTGRLGIVTDDFGNVTGHFANVTERTGRHGLALRMTSTMRAMFTGFGRREHARAPDEQAHDQRRFTT
jgi:hypothetical protein